jgi:hypothetical protein
MFHNQLRASFGKMVTLDRHALVSLGLGEFLIEIARALMIEIPSNTEDLKESIVANMRGINGLLLVVNMEDVHDEGLIEFLKDDIPQPVKVLVTSRIERPIGAYTIPSPELQEFSARVIVLRIRTRGIYRLLERGVLYR